ncbi:hypothetical protein PIB30_027787 [Stylosanthes scabra]|uniref:Ubiquitin-like protease family profile domain-containing protein n=1 Tax=Stylosanthes scabra TaxID=79078 RepID=A0ABU6RB09_9FABA|nr:hypothetical protein [Stylosanthes scabra]
MEEKVASPPESSAGKRARTVTDVELVDAMNTLNTTMLGLSQNLVRVAEVHEQGNNNAGTVAEEIKKAVIFFGVMFALAGKKPATGSQKTGLEANVSGDSVEMIVLDDPKDDYVPMKAPSAPTSTHSSVNPETEQILNKLREGWDDETVLLGSMIRQEHGLSGGQNSLGSHGFVGGSSSGSGYNGFIPPQIQSKYSGLNTVAASRSLLGTPSASKKLRIVEPSPEEAKRSRRMRKAPRQPRRGGGPSNIPMVFPPYIHSEFKITRAMGYTLEEAQAAAYIFGRSMNGGEVLFRRGDRKLQREDFRCLKPGNEPSDYILDLMAYKTSWTQAQMTERTTWSLPSLFSELILDPDFDVEYVIDYFQEDYLPRLTQLKYIYVQMKDILPSREKHHYLMAVDIPNGNIWLFDPNPDMPFVMGRKHAAQKVARALDVVLKTKFADMDFLGRIPPLSEWNPDFVLGMEHLFTLTPEGQSKIDARADKIRMDTAISLCSKAFNDFMDQFLQESMVD